MSKKSLGIIGGSGLYEIAGLQRLAKKTLRTPFGDPSDAYLIGELNGETLVFLPRHGVGHRFNPSEINYRANIYGMKKLGVSSILSFSAVGSMKAEIKPKDVVIVDQFIDRTVGYRKHTFFEQGMVAHVSMAKPVCWALSEIAYQAAKHVAPQVHPSGVYLCMEGPQFSTRAESLLYRSWGVDVIGMTNFTEAKLAREAELCYATLAFSTDYDCWKEDEEAVSAEKVLAVIGANVETAKKIIQEAATLFSKKKSCECPHALQQGLVTDVSKISAKTRKKLGLFLRKHA
ncbi:MAG: S-methyl-5'-thioadenosine phosphorylase [Deltaproteobacteria bacterium]|nr:S-methyl-5'-thioadenosine phosphorylase [Deltaproteobacteria bacterium]